MYRFFSKQSNAYVFNTPTIILLIILSMADTHLWSLCYKKRKNAHQNQQITFTLDKLLTDIIVNVNYYLIPKSLLYISYFIFTLLISTLPIIKFYSTYGFVTFMFYYLFISQVYAALFVFILKFNLLKYFKCISFKLKTKFFKKLKQSITNQMISCLTNFVFEFHILWFVLIICVSITSLLSIFYAPKLYVDENILNFKNQFLSLKETQRRINFNVVWDVDYKKYKTIHAGNSQMRLHYNEQQQYNLTSTLCKYVLNYTKEQEKFNNKTHFSKEYLKTHTSHYEYLNGVYQLKSTNKLRINNFTFFDKPINSDMDCKPNLSSFIIIQVEIDANYTKNYLEMENIKESIEEWWYNISRKFRLDNSKIWWSSEQFERYAIQLEINKTLMISILCPFIFIFICLLITTFNFFTSLYATITIFFILSSTIACTVWLGWRIDSLTCFLYLFVLFISTHYCLLYAIFAHFTLNLTCTSRLKCSIKSIGMPLLLVTGNFVLSAIPLTFSSTEFLNKTATIIILSSILSFLYSTIFLQSVYTMKSSFEYQNSLNRTITTDSCTEDKYKHENSYNDSNKVQNENLSGFLNNDFVCNKHVIN